MTIVFQKKIKDQIEKKIINLINQMTNFTYIYVIFLFCPLLFKLICPNISSENGEPIQILHYKDGQKCEPHFDYFYDEYNIRIGGHRMATVLMYLSDVEKGGETVFPYSEVNNFL